jgi:hypothetical protein
MAAANETADLSCLVTYLAAGKGLNLNSQGFTLAPAAPDGHIIL